MIYHYCSSRGQNCGIASFSEKIDKAIGKSKVVAICGPSTRATYKDVLILEHEYGLHNNIDMKYVKNFPGHKILIMHAFSDSNKHNNINQTLFNAFEGPQSNKIVFLTKTCKIKAATKYPNYMGMMKVIPHYCEELIETDPGESFARDGKVVLGVHGFAFPRNGFTRLLNWYVHNTEKNFNIYMMASLSNFDKVAEKESGVYQDKLRRIIIDNNLEEHVTLDIKYYDTKKEIIQTLHDKCSVTLHMTTPAPYYYNASGSINTLLATGRPVIAFESIFTENLPTGTFMSIKDLNDIKNICSIKGYPKPKWDRNSVIQYHDDRSVKSFINNIL